MRPVFGYQGPLLSGLTLAPGFGRPLGGNNGGGLATTVNSLPLQIESLSSALQNINELANQLTGGIGALMGSLGGNESMNNNTSTQPKLNIPSNMNRVPFEARPFGGINNLLDPRVINNRHLGASNTSYFGNPLQTQLGQLS